MKNKILVMVLVMLMVFSSAAAAFADSGIQPRETASVTYNISRISGTKADATVTVQFTWEADEYSVIVYLQKLNNGVWVNDSTNPEYVFYNNGANSEAFVFSHLYTHLSYGTSYRLMVVSRDIRNGNEFRSTTYSNLF